MAKLIKDLFQQSVDYLTAQKLCYGHGVELAEDEMVLLLMHVLQVDFDTLNRMAEQPIQSNVELKVSQILNRRVKDNMPMAYLIGFSIFAGLKFKIDQRALIPRSPFAELIDERFEPWVNLAEHRTVMDLCTGSGCIGLAIAHYFPKTSVDLVDLSKEALELANENIEVLGHAQQVRCIHSDLFSQISKKYDLIVSNPPYVAEDEYQSLPKEFNYEPKMALVSSHQGMEIPVRILDQAADYLNPDGKLFLEVGFNDEVLMNILPDVEFIWVNFTRGGQGICVFTRADLLKYRPKFKEFLESHVT